MRKKKLLMIASLLIQFHSPSVNFLYATVQNATFHVFSSWVTGAAVVNAFYSTSKNQIGNFKIALAKKHTLLYIYDHACLEFFFFFFPPSRSQCSQQESSSCHSSAKAKAIPSTMAVSAWSLVTRSHTALITVVGLSTLLLRQIMSACALKYFPFCNWCHSQF